MQAPNVDATRRAECRPDGRSPWVDLSRPPSVGYVCVVRLREGRLLIGIATLCGCFSPDREGGVTIGDSTLVTSEGTSSPTSAHGPHGTAPNETSVANMGETGSSEEGASGFSDAPPESSSEGTAPGEDTTAGGDDARLRANADVYRTPQDISLIVGAAAGLLNNDVVSSGPLVAVEQQFVTAGGGTVSIRFDGSFSYAPAESWWGEDTFEYVVTEAGAVATGNVRVVVYPTIAPLAATTRGVGGFALDGEMALDRAGVHVSGVGDLNRDGLADFMVGVRRPDLMGRVHVVLGRADHPVPPLADLGGVAGVVFDGEAPYDYAVKADGAGDVNGDGFMDLLVGAGGAPNGLDMGRAYVLFGRSDNALPSLVEVADGGGFVLEGGGEGDEVGSAVSRVGDVNGDGLSDVLVSSRSYPEFTNRGRVYVVFGRADGVFPSRVDLETGRGGFTLEGEAVGHRLGISATGAGDVNGDGLSDVIVGTTIGRAYVLFGRSDGTIPSLSDIASGVGGFMLESEADSTGNSVSGAGDVNGDGLSDVLIGVPGEDDGTRPGRIFVVFGRSDGVAPSLADVSNGTGGFLLDGESAGDEAGRPVSGAGDVNGDGFSDFIVSALRADGAGESSGRVYVVFGRKDNFPLSLLDVHRGDNGFVLEGADAGDSAGASIASAGDINGDGIADILVGASNVDSSGDAAGRVYVVFGGDFSRAASFRGTAANDEFTGTPSAESILGGRGDDALAGAGGADVLYGGPGDDTITISGDEFFRIDGGPGRDILRVDGDLDLRDRTDLALRSIEVVDITGTRDNSLALRRSAVLSLSETRTLTIVGDVGDEFIADLRGAGFVRTSDVDAVEFTSETARVTVRVDRDVDVGLVQL